MSLQLRRTCTPFSIAEWKRLAAECRRSGAHVDGITEARGGQNFAHPVHAMDRVEVNHGMVHIFVSMHPLRKSRMAVSPQKHAL